MSGTVLGGTGMALIIGVPFTLLAVFGLVMLIHARVWVDGPVLYSRTPSATGRRSGSTSSAARD